ncbi:unnamed protein product [Rotaria magnacalcarata]|uniref:G-protein coupled receptors family 1 profile domain-containing protein n=1 Tax=Rotaria magnacalcarata TaxID=392030 RepID=A0A815GWL0_9BILA|nr:unnamed protein product [Rotaria magnacalcarata]CAF1685520.1 unnamed protein product [Rotaria magnacalcarata]CAF2094326.1 unnamed protein product [Rotaria magnacalcarata]CAF3880962.1 unnamed protein product [Rotaria magnacalcarata]CAF3888558.1 unnamed protein product [Rotaria magnacalcarata]
MHAALSILLVLTIHRCYPAGVPRFLQGDFIRRQIRNHTQTLFILWAFAILITLPIFSITKYERNSQNFTLIDGNGANYTFFRQRTSCLTGTPELWSRAYLILLLVSTYLITGVFLIVIYGQVIRIILASNKYAKDPITKASNNNNNNDSYRFPSSNRVNEYHHSNLIVRINERCEREIPCTCLTSSSTSGSHRCQEQIPANAALVISTPVEQNELQKSSTHPHHSAQHIQIIVMLFIVIILYIILLLPYRLLNLLFIIHNKIFQQTFMNEILFDCLINIVRLLVFLNCALQPITYLIISSRLRQTVIKLLRSWYKCYCYCRFSLPSMPSRQNYRNDHQAVRTFVAQQYPYQSSYQNRQKQTLYRENRPIQSSLNNINLASGHVRILNYASHRQLPSSHTVTKSRQVVSFINGQRQ